MKTVEIEIALANFFDYRRNLIVPNVSWGLNIHECDMLIMTSSGYLTEVEIKISKADLKKDKEKFHGHKSKKIKRLFFAVPESFDIGFVKEHIPDRAGIITVTDRRGCFIKKKPIINNNAIPLNSKDQLHLAHLGAMRVWGLKNKLNKKVIK